MPSWKEQAKSRIKEKKQGDRYKLEPGSNCFRILPNKKGLEKAPYTEFPVHWNVGPDNILVRCGKDMEGRGKCWLCDVKIPELAKSANRQKRDMAESIASRDQFLVQVSAVDPDTGKFGTPKPWWVSTGGPKSLSVALLSTLASPKRSYEHPIKGYNLNIERTGTTKTDTRYGPIEADDEPSKVPENILKLMKSFDELIPAYSSKAQKEAFYGKDVADDEDEEPTDEETEETESEGEEEPEGEEESEESEETELEDETEESEEEAEESEESEEEAESEEESELEDNDEEEEPPPPRKKLKPAPKPMTKKPALTKPSSKPRK